MEKKNDNFYVTTAIDYASGKPHIGHAYEKISADVLARWHRNIGKKVRFQTGTDEHGQKILEKAEEMKQDVETFVEKKVEDFKKLSSKLNISYDYFIRTTNIEHKKIVQEMLQKAFDNGDIYKGNYKGLYCVGCERYYTEDELLEGSICPDHKKPAQFKNEENYFFKLSNYRYKLLEFYKENTEFISPKFKQKEILNRVEGGLKDISISRDKKSLTWGIELPFDKSHVSYVWFDALFNYYSGCKINKQEEFWPANIHIVGHDISWFHLVYWPAFLMSCDLKLPKKVFSHGMILDENGHKMSKSLGNVIDPMEFVEKWGVDEFRFYILASGKFGEDLSFSFKSFAEKVNNDLNNDFGNLISRVHTMVNNYFGGIVPEVLEFRPEDEDFLSKLHFFENFRDKMEKLEFNLAIEILWRAIRETNAYINLVSPWKVEDKKRLGTVISILVSSIKMFGEFVDCFMPEKTKILRKQFNFDKSESFSFEIVEKGYKIGEKINLFSKINLSKTLKKSSLANKTLDKKSEIKHIIFDFDGVIVNNYNLSFEICQTLFGELKHETFKAHHDGNVFENPKIKFNSESTSSFFEEYHNKMGKSQLRPIYKEIKNLSKNYSLYINSSNCEKSIIKVLEEGELKKYFKEIIGVETNKSKIEKFKLLFKKNNFKPEECIFVTDTLGDILEGNKIGVKTIAVDFGFHEKERLEKGNPFKIISKFKQIRKEVEKLNEKSNENQRVVEVEREGFSRLNLKVGKIISIEKHPDSEKLFIEQIDVGEENPRQIVSGLNGFYTKEELLEKKIIVVCNFKPAKLAGIRSEGMILVSESECEPIKIGILSSNQEIGTNLVCNGKIADCPNRIKSSKFAEFDFKSNGERVFFEGKEVFAGKDSLSVDRRIKGVIC